MNNIWLIADTHFNHTNIISYTNRPFEDVLQMNYQMIKNWNNVVKKEDIIYHLGDFGFRGAMVLQDIIKQLNGRKRLIIGNHDRRINKNPQYWRKMGFQQAYIYPIIINSFFILSHKPIMNLNQHTPFVNLHGHLHFNKMSLYNYENLSVQLINYTPINFKQIEKRYNYQNY